MQSNIKSRANLAVDSSFSIQVTVVATADPRPVQRSKQPIGKHDALKLETVPLLVSGVERTLRGQAGGGVFGALNRSASRAESSISEHANVGKSSVARAGVNSSFKNHHKARPTQKCIIVIAFRLQKMAKARIDMTTEERLRS